MRRRLSSWAGIALAFVLLCSAPALAQTYQFADPIVTVSEAGFFIEFFVSLSSVPEAPVTVGHRTEADTAEFDADFVENNGQLSWPAGDGGLRNFSVAIVNDDAIEEDESFWVYLHSGDGALPGELTFLTVTIVDDDGASGGPIASIEILDALIDELGRAVHVYPAGQPIGVEVRLDQIPAEAHTVDWTSDFAPFTGSLTFDDTQSATVWLDPVSLPGGQAITRGMIQIFDAAPMPRAAQDPFDGRSELWFTVVDPDAAEGDRCAACFVAYIFFPDEDWALWCNPGEISGSTNGLARALPDYVRPLTVLSAFRDDVLASTEAGLDLTERYRELSGALASSLIRHPTFGYRVFRAQGPWVDALEGLVGGSGDQFAISLQMQSDLSALLDEFEALADPSDAAALAHERQRLQLDALAGKTMTEFQAQMEELGSVSVGMQSWGAMKARFGKE